MTPEIPYRAAGTFTGEAYVERKADRALAREIRGNQRFPYIVAPRQSGKSSLLVRTLDALDPKEYRGVLVDLSPLPQGDYEDFWRRFLLEVARSGKLSTALVDPKEPEDTFRGWLAEIPGRLVVFVDEIDALIGAPFRDLFFSKVRSLFNQRARDKELRRLQFVLAGAAHPSRLIQDQMRSPFNVGVEIALEELSVDQVRALAAHLESAGKAIDGDVGAAIHAATSGLPFLCQLVLERLWLLAEEKTGIGVEDVEAVVSEIVDAAPRDIHFSNIYEIVANDPRLLEDLGRLLQGKPILQDRARELRLSGLTDGRGPFLNVMYRRVFGRGGSLDLESLVPGLPPAEEKPVLFGLEALAKAVPAPMAAPPVRTVMIPAPSAKPAAIPVKPSAMAAMPAPPMAAPPAEMFVMSEAPGAAEVSKVESAHAATEEEAAQDDAPVSEQRSKLEIAEKEAERASAEPKVEKKIEVAPEKPQPATAQAGKGVVVPLPPPPPGELGKQGSRFGPVATILSFAAAAVISIYVAQQGGLFAQGDIGSPLPPASARQVDPVGATGGERTTGNPEDFTAASGVGATQVLPPATGLRINTPPYGKTLQGICPERMSATDEACFDRTVVKVDDYETCVAAGACEAPEPGPLCNAQGAGLADFPMNCVSYAQADAYCRFMGKRLPTDGEWQAAALAGFIEYHAGDISEWTSTPGDTCKPDDKSCRKRIVRGVSWFEMGMNNDTPPRFPRKSRAEDASSPTVGFRCAK